MVFRLKALTDIWTGGVDIGECSSFRTSGIIGSLRWWYELVVRALGGYACCPIDQPCPDKSGGRCAACELFGCTGWSRKFKLRVKHTNGMVVKDPMEGNSEYIFDFIFTKSVNPEEEWLLVKLLQNVIAPYGSIGGKMPNKPSEHSFNKTNATLAKKQDAIYHRDFGLFEVIDVTDVSKNTFTKRQIENYMKKFTVSESNGSLRQNDPGWPALDQLFCVKGNFKSECFDRLKINVLLGINPSNPKAVGTCLQGRAGEKSKDIFSFEKDRVWGYCQDNSQRAKIVSEIKLTLGSFVTGTLVGSDLLNKLF